MSEKKFVKPDLSQKVDLETEDVFVPKFDGWMRVRELTADERDIYEQSIHSGRENEAKAKKAGRSATATPFRARLVAKVLVDPETGGRLYADEAAEKINKWGAATVDLLFDAAIDLSGMKGKDAEEIEKNSEADPATDSVSN